MTTAYWSVLVAICLPYLWVGIARLPDITLQKNLIPRLVSESLTGFRQRSYWAHQNALEVIAPFAAAVIIAHQLQLQQSVIDTLALTFVAFRVAHALSYMANLGVMRSAMFLGGFVTTVMLFVKAAG